MLCQSAAAITLSPEDLDKTKSLPAKSHSTDDHLMERPVLASRNSLFSAWGPAHTCCCEGFKNRRYYLSWWVCMLPGSRAWDRPQTDSPWSLLPCHRLAARGYVCHISHLGKAGCCNKRKLQLATSCWTRIEKAVTPLPRPTQMPERTLQSPGETSNLHKNTSMLMKIMSSKRQSWQHTLFFTPLSLIQAHWGVS